MAELMSDAAARKAEFDAGFAAGKAAGLEEAWARVNAMIQRGCLPGDGWDETAERNGLVLAANAIREAK